MVDPPITVMAQPTEEIGRTATELLFQRIQEPAHAARLVMLKGSLIARESSVKRK
jgi:LacI family fructose operon transcriptional repressor